MRRFNIKAMALGSVMLVAACSESAPPPPPPPSVGFVQLQLQPVTLTTELPGRIAAVETSEVRPQISGVVRRRLFTEGSLVRAGQVLYEVEDAPYRAALGTAQGQLAAAQATIRASSLQADRYRQLVAINAVSKQEADNAIGSAQQARANVAAQRSAVDAARVNLGFTRIKAPISGRIGRSLFTAGALVQTGQADPLATIQRTDSVYVDVTQSAEQLLNLRAAMQAGAVSRGADSARVQLVLPNGRTYPIEGRLQFSEVTVDQTTGAVTLRARFANPDGMLLPGMYVRARLVEGTQSQALLVPQRAVSRDERGNPTVMVVGLGNKVEPRVLKTDRTQGEDWIVTSGVKPGDRIIVEGGMMLRPGMMVSATPWNPNAKQGQQGKAAAAPAQGK